MPSKLDQFYLLIMELAKHLQSSQYSQIAWVNERTRLTNEILTLAAEIPGTEPAITNIVPFERRKQESEVDG